MTSIVTPTRQIQSARAEIKVEAEDNAMVLMDHGNGVISHVQSGFNYFNPHGHDGSKEKRGTRSSIDRHEPASWAWSATTGSRRVSTWRPGRTQNSRGTRPTRKATSGSRARRSPPRAWPPARQLLVTPEHALHVLEIITAARESQETGRRVALTSTFRWPVGA